MRTPTPKTVEAAVPSRGSHRPGLGGNGSQPAGHALSCEEQQQRNKKENVCYRSISGCATRSDICLEISVRGTGSIHSGRGKAGREKLLVEAERFTVPSMFVSV